MPYFRIRLTDFVDAARHTTGTQGHKPSLMDKLNPMKDADGDGKKGIMD
jgi:hypothetical protein